MSKIRAFGDGMIGNMPELKNPANAGFYLFGGGRGGGAGLLE
jgi:hypothetical protein